MSERAKSEYKVFMAPAWTIDELRKERWEDTSRNLIQLDPTLETDIGAQLRSMGIDGWELASTDLVEASGGSPGKDLILIFKRPREVG